MFTVTNAFSQDEGECGFSKYWRDLNSLGKITPRPILQGEQNIYTTHFKIHYTTLQGNPDATTQAWAESAAVYAEYCWNKYESLGWNTPPNDSSNGGDSRYDIYICNTLPFLGGTHGETNTSVPYPDSWTSWIDIFNDSIPRPLAKYDGLRSLIAHEFSHGIQFGYSADEATPNSMGNPVRNPWFVENCAVYMEDVLYEDVDALWKCRFSNTQDPLDSPGLPIAYFDGGFEYAGGLWPTFLHEKYGSTIIRRIWEKLGQVQGENVFSGIDSTLINYANSNLTEALKNYAVWRYFTGTRADSYHFSEAANYPTSVAPVYHTLDHLGSTFGGSQVFGPGGTGFIKYQIGDPAIFLRMNFDGQNGYNWGAFLIGEKLNSNSDVAEIPLDSNASGYAEMLSIDKDTMVLIPVATGMSNPENGLSYNYSGEPGIGAAVRFTNIISSNNAGGKLLVLPSDTVNSGDWRRLDDQTSYTIETLNERFELPSGNYKHHIWDDDFTKYKLSRTIFTDEYLEEKAQFDSLKSTIIRNQVIDAPSLNFGTIQFRDPWYLHSDPNRPQPDSFFTYTVTTPFSPTGAYNKTTGGVFLNQDPNIPGNPYYSVRAPLKQFLNTRNFMWWETNNADIASSSEYLTGYDTKAVVFHQPNATVKAVYKQNKASSTTLATSGNSQRKIVYSKSHSGISIPMYAGYESGGRVWLTYSTNNGLTWQAEKTPGIVDNGKYVSLLPREYVGEYQIDVVWQSGSGQNKSVYYSKYSPYGIYNPLQLATGITREPKPVIGKGYEYLGIEGLLFVVWVGNSGLFYNVSSTNGESWDGPWSVESISSPYADNPSLSFFKSDSVTNRFTLYLTYEDQDQIYLTGYLNDGNGFDWANPILVDGSNYFLYSRNAQVEAEPDLNNLGKAHIVWEGDEGYGMSVCYQRFSQTSNFGGTWSDPEWWSPAVSEQPFSNPSVAVYSGGKVAITWEDGETVYKINYNQVTNAWSTIDPVMSQAYNSNLITGDRRISIDNSKFIATTGISQPYNISVASAKVTPPPPGPHIDPEPLIVESYRSLEIGNKTTQSKFSFAINSVEVVNTDGTTDSIGLTDISDDASTDVSNVDELLDRLAAKEKVFSSSAKSLKIKYSLKTKNATKFQESADSPIAIAFALKDRDTKNIIRQQKYLSVSSDSVTINKAEITIPISSLWLDKAIIIVPQISGLSKKIAGDKNYYKMIVNRHVIQKRKLLAKPQIADGMVLPTEYQLNQNYPNPFNPTTVISYQLPENGFVTLKIYDVLGKEITTLVNEYKEAGYYEASFDASSLSSGVYFYKLQAGNFVTTKKMLLAR